LPGPNPAPILFGVASEKKPGPEVLDNVLKYWQQIGEKEIRREGNIIYYQYGKAHVSPYGLSIADGLCLCPLVESLDKTLSKTYCQCSAGYVKELFERLVGKPVEVEVLESLRSGGKICRFKIEILSTRETA
jgi:predicted hydrocarbon binding protein